MFYKLNTITFSALIQECSALDKNKGRFWKTVVLLRSGEPYPILFRN